MPLDYTVKIKEAPTGKPFQSREVPLSDDAVEQITHIIAREVPESCWLYSVELRITAQVYFSNSEDAGE